MSVMGKECRFYGKQKGHSKPYVIVGTLCVYLGLVPRILCSVSLMVYRNSHVITAVVETWPACKMFLHGGQRARGSSEICISTDRSRASGRTSGEIMLKIAVIRVAVSVTRARVEGRCARGSAAVVGDDVVVSGVGLPVGDGVEALVKLLGAGEFPFAENSPEDAGTSNGSDNSDDNGKGGSLCSCSARNGGSISSVLSSVD